MKATILDAHSRSVTVKRVQKLFQYVPEITVHMHALPHVLSNFTCLNYKVQSYKTFRLLFRRLDQSSYQS